MFFSCHSDAIKALRNKYFFALYCNAVEAQESPFPLGLVLLDGAKSHQLLLICITVGV